ncbi:hypothetical protein RHO14_10580 [Orbus wheelerorum]|uniref:hypothetical protein n=1 Tax=Orbus wheelerorum TaxID=3074111 RepID=UPI00370DB0E1
MKKNLLLLTLLLMLLNGCHSLNFQDKPKIIQDCNYQLMYGIEFVFAPLTDNQLKKGYVDVYVAQSKDSATLPANYQGVKGKLTSLIIERNYPKNAIKGDRLNPLKDGLLNDSYNDFYLSKEQREIRERSAKFIFQQAVLENCQVVYIAVDSLAQNPNDPFLIEDSALKIVR